ncbi:hypothetical protein N7G274_004531 [Stereocaulon virgatum]|uniref:Ribosomal RNA-processing protein 43 n=1 Tax=Stereocaulon virgatum TaxID=373712 RepID=A0ABR4AA64_9LECA
MAIKPTPPQSSTSPHPLTFPAHTFAKLAPKTYLNTHLNSAHGPVRPSGRSPTQTRTPTCHTGSLTHAHGSAVVRCGDTAVVCGVRGEILGAEDVPDYKAKTAEEIEEDDEHEMKYADTWERKLRKQKESSEEMARLGLLVPNLELATGCSPTHLPGGPPSTLAQTLSQRILTLLHTSNLLDMKDLRIWSRWPRSGSSSGSHVEEISQQDEPAQDSVKAFWVLYIDILFISLDGNPFDAAWLAVLDALKNTRLPSAWWDRDREMVLCSDVPREAQQLTVYGMPVPLSFGVFESDEEARGKRWVLADMDGFEEGLCRETVTVVVGEGEKVVRIEKEGGVGVGGKDVRGLVELAGQRRTEWLEVSGKEAS